MDILTFHMGIFSNESSSLSLYWASFNNHQTSILQDNFGKYIFALQPMVIANRLIIVDATSERDSICLAHGCSIWNILGDVQKLCAGSELILLT